MSQDFLPHSHSVLNYPASYGYYYFNLYLVIIILKEESGGEEDLEVCS